MEVNTLIKQLSSNSSTTSTTSASDTAYIVKESGVVPQRGVWSVGGGSKQLWGGSDPKIEAFLTVVHTNGHSLQIIGDFLEDLDLAHSLTNVTLPSQRFRLITKVRELDMHIRSWARLFQMLLEKISHHYRLARKEHQVIFRHIVEMNGVIHMVHKLLLDCILHPKGHSEPIREPFLIRNVDFRLRGVTASWKQRGGLGALRRTGNAHEAETIVISFNKTLSKHLGDLDERVQELASLQYDMFVEERMQIEMDAQAFVEGLRKKFKNGFKSTHEMAQSMRTVEHYHNCMVTKKDNQDKEKLYDKEEADERAINVPEADTIVQVVQRALKEERNKWQSQLQTQEINLEIERYHKSVILNKQRQREWRQTIALVLVAMLSAGVAFSIARYDASVAQFQASTAPTSVSAPVPVMNDVL